MMPLRLLPIGNLPVGNNTLCKRDDCQHFSTIFYSIAKFVIDELVCAMDFACKLVVLKRLFDAMRCGEWLDGWLHDGVVEERWLRSRLLANDYSDWLIWLRGEASVCQIQLFIPVCLCFWEDFVRFHFGDNRSRKPTEGSAIRFEVDGKSKQLPVSVDKPRRVSPPTVLETQSKRNVWQRHDHRKTMPTRLTMTCDLNVSQRSRWPFPSMTENHFIHEPSERSFRKQSSPDSVMSVCVSVTRQALRHSLQTLPRNWWDWECQTAWRALSIQLFVHSQLVVGWLFDYFQLCNIFNSLSAGVRVRCSSSFENYVCASCNGSRNVRDPVRYAVGFCLVWFFFSLVFALWSASSFG